MPKSTKTLPKECVSLLWAQYNKLSKAQKKAFVILTHSIAEESENRNTGMKKNNLEET